MIHPSRREFIAESAGVFSAFVAPGAGAQPSGTPWYRRCYRWGQTNITELDPKRYDIPWWREYWKRTNVQGVIINAGGIVAYYPSQYPLHHRAQFLDGRDLFGELTEAAHSDGLAVLARMDSNRAAEDFFQAHPDWFTRDANGNPYRAADKYITCINSAYYEEYLPEVMREIIERSRPEGLTDNSWAGLGRDSICYCDNCARRFQSKAGRALPRKHDWDDSTYRDWIEWNYARRLEIWDLNNRVTQSAGGPDCIWAGMNSGSVNTQSRSFRDYKEICRRAQIIMLDHQARSDSGGFQQNTDSGKLIHGLLGWDKLIPESMAMYQAGRQSFRVASKPAAEARMWMVAGFAGGIQPWWHHISAYHEDRRMYRTAEPVLSWHKANEQFLVNRRPMATVGVVWSQQNTDFYGRNSAEELVDQPYRGVINSLIRARIPYIPVHADHIARDGDRLSVLVLPNVAAMSDPQVEAVRRFTARGGGLVATGVSSLYTERGDARKDFALADLFGAHASEAWLKGVERRWAGSSAHTYLRLAPELRARVWGPRSGDEPVASGERHEVLRGFEETDILPFGGELEPLRVEQDRLVPFTFVPAFPVYPPETAWMRQPKTDIAGLVLRDGEKSRVAYLPADLDRRFARENLPDHAHLLANLVNWAAAGNLPLAVECRGLVGCDLYEQPGRLVLHLVNFGGAGRLYADELLPVGPVRIRVRLPDGFRPAGVRCTVSGDAPRASIQAGWIAFSVRSVEDHEVVVIG